MSGLFLNFYHIDIELDTVSIPYKLRSEYPTKDDFISLKKEYPNNFFYSFDDKILFWNNIDNKNSGVETVSINLNENYKVLSKFLTDGIIDFVKEKGYAVFKNKYSHTWEIKSNRDILNGTIQGIEVNRVIELSPYFFTRENKRFIGFSLSTFLKNCFTWDRQKFVENGIDTQGLKGNDDKIYANSQSIKRFLESKGASITYDSNIEQEKTNAKSFEYIDKFYSWLSKNQNNIKLPFGLNINSITKRYLPFENELIKSEIIWRPERYFYSNRKNTQKLKYYDQMVKAYQPYSLELFQNKVLNVGIICPKEYQGETEGFASKLSKKLKEVFHFKSINFILKTVDGKSLSSYKTVLYDNEIQNTDLIYIIVDKEQEKLEPKFSPYYVCKAKFIGNGIPTQDVQIETIRQNLNAYTMANIALNSYAKLGGTAWTIEKEDKLKDELIVGIGSTVTDEGKYVLGIAQVFHNDGRYMTGDCSALSTFDNYSENLENHLYNVLKPL